MMSNSNEDLKEIYNCCVECDWNTTKIRELASSLNMTYEKTLYSALTYAKDNVSEDDYKKICKMVSNNKKGRYELDVPNPFLLKKGEVVYRIWRNCDEKLDVLKYIYDSWMIRDTKEVAKEFGFDSEKILRLVKDYALGVLKMSIVEWQEVRDKVKQSKSRSKKRNNLENISGNAKVLSRLIKADTLHEIVSVLDNVYDLINLKGSIHDYLIIYYDIKDYNKYRDILISKLALYSAYQKEKEKQKKIEEHDKYVIETLPNAVQLITTFVESDCNSVQEFIESYKIIGNEILNGERIFKECLKLVRRYNLPLYGMYTEKVEKRRQQNYHVITNLIITIINYLKEGIDEYERKRSFDIIDYFKLTSIPIFTLLKVGEDMERKHIISAREYSIFARFGRNNLMAFNANYDDLDKIYKEKREINCVKNSKGYPIPGTGEIISDSRKEKLINYLRDNGIPVNYINYNALLNRYKNGFLELNDFKKY